MRIFCLLRLLLTGSAFAVLLAGEIDAPAVVRRASAAEARNF